MVKGSKPRTPLRVIAGPGRKRSAYPCPAWLPAEARAEWNRAVQDLSSRGLMFDGALASLEHYVLCIAQIRQCQQILAEQPIADDRGHPPGLHGPAEGDPERPAAGGRAGAVGGEPGASLPGQEQR